MRAVATAVVPVPPDQVWAVLADHEAMSSWGPGVTVTVTKEGVAERNGVGAVRKIAAAGPAPAVIEEITRFDPGTALGYKALAGAPLKNYRGLVELSPVGEGTQIAWSISADQRLPLAEKAVAKTIATVLLRLLVRAVKK
ncbi:SRPBCC family protein [Nocardioides antri]|uniref:SRPBCC family protein n=1 Tax=Nocardioides antri TaxID=2607659 RepID=A0A5B1LZC9_9ACTN|nr:SRPBCC family protein [Nocardioides antri]KAA1425796.1 SRPBCC family protein [Nocardioides antri]